MTVVTAAGRQPPGFLRLAAHPLRWRLLLELAHSDRRVRELSGLLGQPQPLVSYHLGRLQAEQVVQRRRSAFDGRESYYLLDLARCGELLAATGGALHPGLRRQASAPAGTPHGSPLAARRVRRSSSKRPHAAALNPFPRSSGGPHREAAAADPAALIGAGRLHQVAGDLTRLASTTNARDAGFLPIHRSRIALAASTGYTPKSHAHKTRVSARRPRRRPRLC